MNTSDEDTTPEEFDAAFAAAEPVEIVLGPRFRVVLADDQDELDNPVTHRRAMRRRRPSWADEE